jgi:predicted SAM-dependent methyltransferase
MAIVKVNFGCFNSNLEGWIGVDHALRYILVSRIPLLGFFLWKIGRLNDEQFGWIRDGVFRTVRYGDAARRLAFDTNSVDHIYCSHMLEHLFRDQALVFLRECHRILKDGGTIRVCIPDWDTFRTSASFEDSAFAKSRRELRISHKWLWTESELRDAMSTLGFREIVPCEFQQGEFPDLQRLEHREGLIIQAQR